MKCNIRRATEKYKHIFTKVQLYVCGGQQVPSHPVLGKLEGGAATALAFVMRPLDCIPLYFAAPGDLHLAQTALFFNIQAHCIQIAILRESITRDTHTE